MALYINRIDIKNIRCIHELVIVPGRKGGKVAWTALLGDNSTGKTSILRSIAMGLCDESSAAALLNESNVGTIRNDEREAVIKIQLFDTNNLKRRYSIRTIITHFEDGKARFERVRQVTYPRKGFPWNDIFVCAYGAGRGTSGTGDVAEYSPINATYSLFNYREGLQNPELALLRIRNKNMQKAGLRILEKILPNVKRNDIKLTDHGITFTDRVGTRETDMPFHDIADGLKSCFLWIIDFLGWAISRNPNLRDLKNISGIVLIDEIEQHLHPSWRSRVITDLRSAFPKVQFISTTHSEAVARSVGGPISDGICAHDVLYRLYRDDESEAVRAKKISHISGLTADQALMSDAFRLQERTKERVSKWVKEYKKLSIKENRSTSEENTYQTLREYLLSAQFQPGEDEIEREIKFRLRKELTKIIPPSRSQTKK